MGLFDSTETYERFGEKFNIGDRFTLESLAVGPTISTTAYGEQATFLATIAGVTYMGFGVGIIRQAENSKPENFPAEVVYGQLALKGGKRMKQFYDPAKVPEGALTPEGAKGKDDDIPF